jgi:hypothetical protein
MGAQPTNTITPNERLGRVNLNEFIAAALNYKANAEWKGDKRFYLTLLPNVESIYVDFGNLTDRREIVNYNIRTRATGSYNNGDGSKITKNLAELSTAEIVSHDASENQVTISKDFPLNQQYIAQPHGDGESEHDHAQTPPKFSSGSFLISKLNDDNPSLLVELNRDQQLPNGLGDKEFVVIPNNLHPYIKDNLEYFLIQAGINVSGDASQYLKIDETNRNLP